MRKALERLGYGKCYHMMCASVENPPDCLMWHDALNAKYKGIGEFGRKEWDQLLGDCQAVCDWPACAFAKELIEAYPNAKVILTTRDVDPWHAYVYTGEIRSKETTTRLTWISQFRHEDRLLACQRPRAQVCFPLQLGREHVLPHAEQVLRDLLPW